jgi:hypothetical protein
MPKFIQLTSDDWVNIDHIIRFNIEKVDINIYKYQYIVKFVINNNDPIYSYCKDLEAVNELTNKLIR